ncbi:ketoacyl-ACP synthase III family protein [Streptacidiphilus monticola]
MQDNSIGGHAATAEVRQGSNGGLVGFELAASWVAARPDTAALVTAGDSFHLPYFDRWNSDDQQVFGDGAGALVLSTRTGFARVLGSTTYADSTLEPIYRGGDWTTGPFAEGRTVSLRSRKRDFLATGDNLYEQTIERMTKSLFAVTGQLFDELGLGIDDMAYLIHANTGQTIVDWGFYHPLGVDVSRTVYEWGRDFGHMGAADHIVNLNHLVETAPLKPGDKVLTIGVGTGFIWTAFVMEILEPPPGARRPEPPSTTEPGKEIQGCPPSSRARWTGCAHGRPKAGWPRSTRVWPRCWRSSPGASSPPRTCPGPGSCSPASTRPPSSPRTRTRRCCGWRWPATAPSAGSPRPARRTRPARLPDPARPRRLRRLGTRTPGARQPVARRGTGPGAGGAGPADRGRRTPRRLAGGGPGGHRHGQAHPADDAAGALPGADLQCNRGAEHPAAAPRPAAAAGRPALAQRGLGRLAGVQHRPAQAGPDRPRIVVVDLEPWSPRAAR